ncbi:MAG: Clp protease ClpP [Sphingobacteriaceae bacterium]|nr:Clp protease ClpP [Sphingobacteriaceae bacterium]
MLEIKLYEPIEQGWSYSRFAQELDTAGGSDVLLRIHSPGGSVMEGNMIFNAIKNYKGTIHCQIDGMAASMAAIIPLACKHITIAENGFMMIHAPSCYINGTSKDFEEQTKLLKSIENQFKSVLKIRTKLSEQEIEGLMDGGDHWFTSDEALAMGLVDEVISLPNIDAKWSKLDLVAAYKQDHTLSKYFEHKLNTEKMNQILKTKAITLAATADVAIAETADAEQIVAGLLNVIEKNVAQRKELKDQLNALETAQITAVIDDAVSAKKITENQRITFEHVGKQSGVKALMEIFAGMAVPQSIASAVAGATGSVGIANAEDRKNWDWDQWQAKDSKGLEAMEKANPEQFNSLYKAKYNSDLV